MMALRRSAQLERLLCEQPAGWFARGWDAEVADALGAAVQRLRALAGADTARWAWGRVRTLTLEHPLGVLPVLGRAFNVGPLPCGGDATTIPQASVDFAHPTGNPIGIPNLRVVMDVGNWSASRWVLAGGQSGNPLSAHYADMVPRWERGDGVALAWEPAAVERAARATLTLLPGASALD
jgi:penicillin amidase